MKTNRSKSAVKLFVIPVLVIALFVGLSFVGSDRDNAQKLAFDPSGYNKVYADSTGWQGVRGVATLIRAATKTFNNLYSTVKYWGFLLNYSFSWSDFPVPGTPFTSSGSINKGDKAATATVDSGSVNYSNAIQIKYGATIIFQFFFDDPRDSSSGDGCLLIVKPYYFESTPGTAFDSTGVFEARVKKATDIIMYVSFSGHPWKENTDSHVESGRFKVIMSSTDYKVAGLAYVHVDGSPYTICAGAPAEGHALYTLAYIVANDTPYYYSTALWGWNDTLKSNQICGVANPQNYGHFNASAGFVCDGADSATCDDAAPYPLSTEVDTLYGTGMNTGSAQEFQESTIMSLAIPDKSF